MRARLNRMGREVAGWFLAGVFVCVVWQVEVAKAQVREESGWRGGLNPAAVAGDSGRFLGGGTRAEIGEGIAADSNQNANNASGTGELIPAPPPPLEAGEARFLRDRTGKVRPWTVSAQYSKAEMHVTSAELKAFDENLHKIMDFIGKAPVLNPPMGFELDVQARLGSFEDVKERARNIATHMPLHGGIRFSGSSYLEIKLRNKSTGALSSGPGIMEEAYCRYEMEINVPPLFNSYKSDSEGTIFLEPKKDGILGGMPVYEDTLVISRPGVPLWVPVSTERALKFILPRWKRGATGAQGAIEHAKANYAEYMSPAKKENRRREVQELRNKGSEVNAKKLEGMQRRSEEEAREEAESAPRDPKWLVPIHEFERIQAMLATMDAAGRAAPACVITGTTRGTEDDWRVMPMGTPGCRPVVQSNPALLNRKLPRSEVQVIYIWQVTKCNDEIKSSKYMRNAAGDCVAMAKIMRQTDWKELANLLAH